MKLPTFETKRLILREISLTDEPSYKNNFVDYEVIRHLSAVVPWPYPEDGIKDFIQNFILPNQGKDRWMWGIFLKENPTELIGAVDLWREGKPENRGFWLGKKHWGKGIMTEAVFPVMDYAFNKLSFEKLTFANAVGNKASRRVKEKTGAKLIGVKATQFVDPQYTESEVWELEKKDWFSFKKTKNTPQVPFKFLSFPGKIHLINTDQELKTIVADLESQKELGFDTETRPSFKKGESHPVALLQLATNTDAYIIRLKHIKNFESIKALFENPAVIKVGAAIRDDLKQLQKRFAFEPKGFIELQTLAKTKNLQNIGLKGMTEEVLEATISKGPKTTNWEAQVLSEKQILYAATDAWIGLKLYQKLSLDF